MPIITPLRYYELSDTQRLQIADSFLHSAAAPVEFFFSLYARYASALRGTARAAFWFFRLSENAKVTPTPCQRLRGNAAHASRSSPGRFGEFRRITSQAMKSQARRTGARLPRCHVTAMLQRGAARYRRRPALRAAFATDIRRLPFSRRFRLRPFPHAAISLNDAERCSAMAHVLFARAEVLLAPPRVAGQRRAFFHAVLWQLEALLVISPLRALSRIRRLAARYCSMPLPRSQYFTHGRFTGATRGHKRHALASPEVTMPYTRAA